MYTQWHQVTLVVIVVLLGAFTIPYNVGTAVSNLKKEIEKKLPDSQYSPFQMTFFLTRSVQGDARVDEKNLHILHIVCLPFGHNRNIQKVPKPLKRRLSEDKVAMIF